MRELPFLFLQHGSNNNNSSSKTERQSLTNQKERRRKSAPSHSTHATFCRCRPPKQRSHQKQARALLVPRVFQFCNPFSARSKEKRKGGCEWDTGSTQICPERPERAMGSSNMNERTCNNPIALLRSCSTFLYPQVPNFYPPFTADPNAGGIYLLNTKCTARYLMK